MVFSHFGRKCSLGILLFVVPLQRELINVSMSKQLTDRQKAMRQTAFDYLHFLTDQEMMIERIVDQKLTEMKPQIEQMIEEKVTQRLEQPQKD